MAGVVPKIAREPQDARQRGLRKKVVRQYLVLRRVKHTLEQTRQQLAESQRKLAGQNRDIQFMNKTLIRMNNLLKHVYSYDPATSRGMKMLINYYRLRDHWLPIGTLRRKAFEGLVGILNLDKVSSKSPINVDKLAKLKTLKEGLAHELYEQGKRYQEWIKLHEPDEAEKERQRRTKFALNPKLSIVVPLYDTPTPFLQDLLASLRRQTYGRWEACLAVSGEHKTRLVRILAAQQKQDQRIRYKVLDKNLGIAGNSNQALTLATGDFITFMDHDDRLPEFALYEVVKAINEHPELEFIYSDEDKISANGQKRFDPHFKPDFSPDTLRSYNYICHLTVIKKSLLRKVRGFRLGYDGSQDYDLFLRATDFTRHIGHIPKILYHWRVHETSTAQSFHSKSYAMEAAQKALTDHLKRRRLPGKVGGGMLPTTYSVRYAYNHHPKVAIIIPTRDQAPVLKKCVSSILEKTAYKNFGLYLVDTGSRDPEVFKLYRTWARKHPNVKVLKHEGEFNFSRVNNYAAKRSRGDILLFLNNDTEVINPGWLENMLQHAQRPEIGAVGAKLYYPDETIQHAGVILGIRGVAGHSHKYFSAYDPGYFFRLKIVQNFSAVTAACLMLRREVFTDCGGFDERYSLAFGDVDLCLKIRKRNKLIVWTPYAELYHAESKTRGYEDTPDKQRRFLGEQDLFKQKWEKELAQGDPYYNPNLTLLHEDFSLRTQEG